MQNATTTQPAKRIDVQQMATDIIIQQLETGVIPWQQPWDNGNSTPLTLPMNQVTGKGYRGVNIVLLWSAAIKHGYKLNEWASFKQWSEKKESIRKGEKGNLVVYYDTFERDVEGEIQKIPYVKYSVVFNRCQLASFDPASIRPAEEEPKPLPERIAEVDIFLENTQALIVPHGGGAFYRPSEDRIYMPHLENFIDTDTCTALEGFYSTSFHEVTHWTGAKHRLNRTTGKKFGDHDYAVEELTAEFGAAFLCAGFGLRTLDKGDHAGYIQNWLKVLKDNKQILFSAASDASKAVDYLHTLQPGL